MAIGCIVISGTVSAAGLANSSQPKFHHDSKNTGQSQYNGSQTNHTKWNYTTGGAVQSSPVIGSDGTVYVGSNDHYLYAFNPNTGALKWRFGTEGIVYSSPAIGSDGTIYVGSADHKLYALTDAGTHANLKWSYLTQSGVLSSPAIGSDETIYFGSNDHYLYALNGTNGAFKWRFDTLGVVYSSPAIGSDGTIYCGNWDGDLYALTDAGTQANLKWIYSTSAIIDTSPAIGSDGTIYFGCTNNHLYALTDAGTYANLKWNYTNTHAIYSSPAIGSDGTIYFGSDNGNLYAITDAGTQANLKWNYTTDNGVRSSPAVGSDGTVYVGSYDSKLYALQAPATGTNGVVKWSYATGNSIYSSPAIGSDGTIYFGNDNGNLYAIQDVPKPDLIVQNLTPVSVTVHQGGTLDVNTVVKNIGGGDAGSFQTWFFLSTDDIPQFSDTVLGIWDISDLAAGATKEVNSTFNIPLDLALGNYYLWAVADIYNSVEESNNYNNFLTAQSQVTVLGRPELIVHSISSPATAHAGDLIPVSNEIRNIGNADADHFFLVDFYISTDTNIDISSGDRLFGCRQINNLAAGNADTDNTLFAVPSDMAPGIYYIGARIDADHFVTEFDETNNIGFSVNQITINGMPDLVIQNLTGPAAGYIGKTISINNTIKNNGSAAAGAFSTNFYLSTDSNITLSDLIIGNRSISSLATGATNSTNSVFTIPNLIPGYYYIGAITDFGDAVTESDETNNSKYVISRINILSRPDLVVQSLVGPVIGYKGKTINVTNTIKNIGTAAAGTFYTRFYLSKDSNITTSDTLIGSRTINSLNPGATSTNTIALTIPTSLNPGYYYIGAICDRTNTVAESNENNNTKYAASKINILSRPDLSVYYLSGPKTGTSAGSRGKPIIVTNIIKNTGTLPANGFYTKFYLSKDTTLSSGDIYLGYRYISSLKAGSSSIAKTTLKISTKTAKGTYYLIAYVDTPNRVAESNETNNKKYSSTRMTIN